MKNTLPWEEIKSVILRTLKISKKSKPIDSLTLAVFIRNKFDIPKFSPTNVRKIVNELRKEGTPIIASSKGYWYSEDKEEILYQIVSMKNRILSQQLAIDGLNDLLNEMKYEENAQ